MSGADNDWAVAAGRGPSLGVLLRGLRERALLTQEGLAARSALSVGTISGIETGRIQRPRSGSLRLLADALKLDGPERQALLGAGRDQPDDVPLPAGGLRQLPADVATFTGREQELARLERALAAADKAGPKPGSEVGPLVVSAIQGGGGIGKSALAIHAAHRLAGRYPDGQLYVDLHGATIGLEPLAPLEVLGRFLRALGVDPAAIPTELDEAAARFRSELAGRRMLVVLDNARDAAQVRPLLPAAAGCGAVVTSRRALSGLDGARHLHLDVLTEREAIALLARLAGAERVAAEPQAAAEVVRCCGYLPLALRIAGARLAARPAWPLRRLAERLADARWRLDELELAEVGVRASFAVSQQELAGSGDPIDRAAARAFELLGLLDGPDVGVPVAARLLDWSEIEAERALERLVDTHLLDSPVPGRYRLHDLLRLYARELACAQYAEAVRAAALTHAFGLYVATAWHTLALLRPDDPRLERADHRWHKDWVEFADATAALGWLETERANLLAATRQAAITPGVPSEISVQLAHGLFGFCLVRSYWQDWIQVNQTALKVARQVGDRGAEAQAHNDLGVAYWRQGRLDQALACFQRGLALYRDLGGRRDRRGLAASLGNLGIVRERLGQYERALACHNESLSLCRRLGDQHGQAISLGNLAMVMEPLGRHEEAMACLQESLTIYRQLGDHRGQAVSLGQLGEMYQGRCRYEEASACLQESLTIYRQLGDRYGQAVSLHDQGIVYQRQDCHEHAHAALREGLAIRRELGDRRGLGESLRDLGVTLRALSREKEARAAWSEALGIFEQLQTADADHVRDLLAARSAPG